MKKLAVLYIGLVWVCTACTTTKVSTPQTPQSQPITTTPQATPQPEKQPTDELKTPAQTSHLKAGQRKAIPDSGSNIRHSTVEMVPDSIP